MNYLIPLLLTLLACNTPAQTREHRETSITFELPAEPAVALPLFGPVRESEWSPHWTPHFLYPAEKQQIQGAVFTTRQHDADWIWNLITYDEKVLRVEYVIVWPGVCATRLDIALRAAGKNASHVAVTYRQTALSEHGDEYVRDFAAHFPAQRDHWQQAISARLRQMVQH